MIFATSLPRFKVFLGDFSCKSTDMACCVLFLTPFLLPTCRRSVAAAAHSVLNDVRDAGWMLRWLGSSSAPQAMLAAAQVQLLTLARDSAKGLHILILDSTFHGQQGKNTQNTIATGNTKKRAKKSDRHQKKTHRHSGHCFVFALLLTPNGLRIPYWLPFFTKPHCELFGRKHISQASLAAQLVDSIPLPQGSRVVVVGDTAFEAKQIRQACARRNWQWVVPLNPERRLAGKSPRPKVRSLYEQLTSTDFRKVSLRLDQGDLAAMARVSPSRSKAKKHERTYWVHHRTAAVHNVGEVALLFSRLTEPTPSDVKVQKLLISNAVAASTEELLLWYSLRWQIELFFKEMKSELGMCQYKLGTFQRVQGWVNLSVVAFCYLEWTRWQSQQQATGKDKPFWQRLRTAGLKEKIRQQVQRAEIESLLALAGNEEGRECLKSLLDKICDNPAAAA
jgi:hypothetical protein